MRLLLLMLLHMLAVIMCSLITSIDPAPTAVYASSVGTTSGYDCSLNEYYPNECSLFLEGGAPAAPPRGGPQLNSPPATTLAPDDLLSY